MERDYAIEKLKSIYGINLHELAKEYGITVIHSNGKINKGWAGHVIERVLGLPLNSSKNPNFGSWELKTIPLKLTKSGALVFKETMAICMIDTYNVIHTEFEESHLLAKLNKALVVARIVGAHPLDMTTIHTVAEINLSDEMRQLVKLDYEEVRQCLSDIERGQEALSGKMGVYIQPRTKGTGHGSVSRAFYARKCFLREYIKI